MKTILKDYQRQAINDLKNHLNYLRNKRVGNKECIFKAPTGSGKTFIISSLLHELCSEDWADENFCIIWACPGKGNLHEQSYDAVKTYCSGLPSCSLIDEEFFGSRKYIRNKEIVFINWEKLVQKDSETGKWVNNLMKDKEGMNFIDVLDNTKKNNTSIILVVDESHIGLSQNRRISEFKNNIIIPDISIEMSATPLSDRQPDIIVETQDVIDEGMIKTNLIVNEGIKKDDLKIKEIDSELLILQKGFDKAIEIKNEFKRYNIGVNPLVLVQIPNTNAGEMKKTTVRDFLRKNGITEENGKLKIWCDNSGDFDKKEIRNNLDLTEFLIFKTAVATGWDCPRAQILIKFRDSKSETFEIQTIGRILRTPEAKHYENELLDNAYMYTNLSDFKFDKDSYNPNRIKTEISIIREPFNAKTVKDSLCLHSFYKSRAGHFNTVTHSFIEKNYFLNEFIEYFGIKPQDIKKQNFKKIKEEMEAKGLKLNLGVDDKIISQTNIESKNVDETGRINNDLAIVKLSSNDIKIQLFDLIKINLNGLAYKRSRTTVLMSIISCFNLVYDVFPKNKKISSIYKIIVNNKDIFGKLISDSTAKFKANMSDTINKGEIDRNNFFEITQTRAYSTETHIKLPSKKSLYQPLYVLRKSETEVRNKLESDFINYLDNSKHVTWFWENGAEQNKVNFGIGYDDDTRTFYPDFIVKFSDGTIGIFDTKAYDNSRQNIDTKFKAEALYKYIKQMNQRISTAEKKTPKLVGGIVVQPNPRDKNNFLYSDSKEYKLLKDDAHSWKNVNEIIRNVERQLIKKGKIR